jgi:hypothetical protein
LPNSGVSGGVNYFKSLRYYLHFSCIYENNKNSFGLFSNAELPVSLVSQNAFSPKKFHMDEDLIVFIIDENRSFGLLQKIFNSRLKTSMQVRLIDVSAFESSDTWKLALMGIAFDLNDDVFLYSHDIETNIFYIWEVYKIDPKRELIILNHGNWSASDGLKLTKEIKWKRRRDLQVHFTFTFNNFYVG